MNEIINAIIIVILFAIGAILYKTHKRIESINKTFARLSNVSKKY